jgi:hypothetical protein
VKNFFDWMAETDRRDKPGLILGKGPSFSLRDRHDLSSYTTMSLNHTVRELPVDIAHIIDIDVVPLCAEALLSNAGVLAMPWYPHVKNFVGDKTLEQWVQEVPTLRKLDVQGRLLWYDLISGPLRHGTRPVVNARKFSAEAGLQLFALAGVRKVRSLGVDGGTTYSTAFNDLKDVTRLNNGHPTYDLQFEGFACTIYQTGVDYSSLAGEAPVRVYVGSQEEQMLAVKVLAHSIRRHASMTVEVYPLHRAGVEFARPRDSKNWPRTPFSFQRFAIPMLAGHKGRAIYVDSDMQVFRDIRDLWTLPFDGAQLLAAEAPPKGASRRPQFSVMLLDCENLEWTPESVVEALDSGRLSYEQLMFDMALAKKVAPAISHHWNSLERFDPEKTCLLHYTDMQTQPWIYTKNVNGHLWVRELLLAIDKGDISVEEVREHVERGWVRPSLLGQVQSHSEKPSIFNAYGRFADRKFEAPYKRIPA